jgi:hypothetical protein
MQPEANHASENFPRFTVNLPTRSVATGAAVLNHISACDENSQFPIARAVPMVDARTIRLQLHPNTLKI